MSEKIIHEKLSQKLRELQPEDCGCVVQRSREWDKKKEGESKNLTQAHAVHGMSSVKGYDL